MTYDQFIHWQLKSPITTVLLDLVASMFLVLHTQCGFPYLEVSSTSTGAASSQNSSSFNSMHVLFFKDEMEHGLCLAFFTDILNKCVL